MFIFHFNYFDDEIESVSSLLLGNAQNEVSPKTSFVNLAHWIWAKWFTNTWKSHL